MFWFPMLALLLYAGAYLHPTSVIIVVSLGLVVALNIYFEYVVLRTYRYEKHKHAESGVTAMKGVAKPQLA